MSRIDPKTIGIGKFGYNADIDTAAPEDIWSQGGTRTEMTASTQLYISSSNAGDTTQVVSMIGLNSAGKEVMVTATLSGQSQVALSAELADVYRGGVSAATLGDVYIAESDTLSGGVPTTATKIKAKIDIGQYQTQMAISRVPAIVGTKTVRKAWIAAWGFGIHRGSPVAGSAVCTLYVNENDSLWVAKTPPITLATGVRPFYEPLEKYIEVAPLTQIKVRCDSVSANDFYITGNYTVFYDIH